MEGNPGVKLGGFQLQFNSDGKLAELIVPGGTSVLHRAVHTLALERGRTFPVGGWDECFPTIGSDMGGLIGVAPVLCELPDRVEQEWVTPDYQATRTFRAPAERTLELIFHARNTGAEPLEFLWASHALFSFDWIQRIVLANGLVLDDFRLNGTSRKFFVKANGPIRIDGAAVNLLMSTDQPHWGIWFNRGGWPASQPAEFGCIGLEATSTAADEPTGQMLAPGAEFVGRLSLEVAS
jgi:hypothetical protein